MEAVSALAAGGRGWLLPLVFLLPAAVWDAKTLRVPSLFTLPMLGAALADAALRGRLETAVAGALAALVAVAALNAVGFGLGGGDAKLAAACAAWLGFAATPAFLFATVVLLVAAHNVKSLRRYGLVGFARRVRTQAAELLRTGRSSVPGLELAASPYMAAAYLLTVLVLV